MKLVNEIAFRINPDNTNKLRRESVFAFFNILLNKSKKKKQEIVKQLRGRF